MSRSLTVAKTGFFGQPHGDVGEFTGFMFGPDGLSGVGESGTSGGGEQRPGQHGEFDEQVFLTGQVVTVSGTAIERLDAKLDQLGVILGGLGAGGARLPLKYTSALGDLFGHGRVIARRFAQRRGGIPKADYMLSVRKADPRWYGVARTFVSSGEASEAHHRGNFEALPVFDVAGNSPGGYRLRRGGLETFNVSLPLVPGQPHRVDFRTRTVSVGGVAQFGAVARPEVWTLPAGPITSWRILDHTTAGTYTATMTVPDTFVF